MKHVYFLFIALCLLSGCLHPDKHRRNVKNRNVSPRTRSTSTMVSPVQSKAPRQVLSGADIFKKYNSAVFMIYTSDGKNVFQGSGFFISASGIAVSNYHVFNGTEVGFELIQLADGKRYKVKEVIAKNKQHDFIIFKVQQTANEKFNYIPIADKRPQVGEKVYAIGSPRGLQNTFSSGEVSQWRDQYLMQINALIDHGSSGGALINEYGEVIGITSGSFYDGSQANLNYAWSIQVVKPYFNKSTSITVYKN